MPSFNAPARATALLALASLLLILPSPGRSASPDPGPLDAAAGPATASEGEAGGLSPAAQAAADWAQISGRVHVQGAPDPLPGVLVQSGGLSVLSGAGGAYLLSASAGTWVLHAGADGFAPLTRTVTLKPGERRVLNLGLVPVSFVGAQVEVHAHRDPPQAIQATVTQAQIKEIPGTFGDAVRSVQVLPGVGIPNDFSGQILVQGAGPGDNLYLVDNLPWPIPFHFGGLVSTVSPDLLDKVDLYEAGYGARWDGSLASVLDAKTVSPPSDRLHVDADVSILWSSVVLDGPLGLGDATFALTGRRSYFDLVGGLVKISPLPVFWDSQGVLDFTLGRHNHFHALAMSSDDSFDVTVNPSPSSSSNSNSSNDGFSGTIVDNQDFQSGGLSWINTSLENVTSTFTPYAYHTDSILTIDNLGTKTFQTTFGVKEEGTWTPGAWHGMEHTVGIGGAAEVSNYSFNGYFPRITSTGQVSFAALTSMAATASAVTIQGQDGYAYLMDRVQLDRQWAMTLGLHYGTSSLVAQGMLGPRASLEWRPLASDKLTAAWGLYDQVPVAIDVNPQYGNPGLQPENAEHVALSYEHSFRPDLSVKVDGYYKTLTSLVEKDPSNPLLYDNLGAGDSKGLDFYLKEDLGERLFGWISYSLSKSERLNLPSQAWGSYEYDQPNIVNIIGSWSPRGAWTFGLRERYASGNLVQPEGSPYYSQRLRDYSALDLRVERTWRTQMLTLKAYVELLNALDRKNIAMEVTNSQGQTDSIPDLPRLPLAGLEIKY